jgi:hypothetical protein
VCGHFCDSGHGGKSGDSCSCESVNSGIVDVTVVTMAGGGSGKW